MEDREARSAWFMAEILPHRAALKSRLRRMDVPAADLDDFTAEALARAYGCGGWRDVERGQSFLFHIARNLVFDAARRRTVIQFDALADLTDLVLVDIQPSPETVVSDRQRLNIVRAAVQELPPSYREIFRLRRLEDVPTEETARRLGLSVSAVEKRLAIALLLLKDAIANRDGSPHVDRIRARTGRRRTRRSAPGPRSGRASEIQPFLRVEG